MKKYKGLIVTIVVVVVIAAAALILGGGNKSDSSKSSSGSSKSSSQATATDKVGIKDYMFGPGTVKVKVGTTVTWTNSDSVNHTVTADEASADAPSSMDIPKAGTYSFTFKKAGTYPYHCFPHPYMHGTVIVE